MQRFCLAEYCRGPFYMGWWLYERETNDGRANTSGACDWGWLRECDSWSPQQKLHELCCRMGYEPPPVQRYRQTFARWFAKTFPNGLLVRVHPRSVKLPRYELIEIVKRRPRQRAGVIRTIRGEKKADAADTLEREAADASEKDRAPIIVKGKL